MQWKRPAAQIPVVRMRYNRASRVRWHRQALLASQREERLARDKEDGHVSCDT
jgi:hypothetical protein